MKCPKCNNVLITVERNDIELEYCPECGGFWLDADEWTLIKENFEIPFEIVDLMKLNPVSLSVAGEDARYCPVCVSRMEKISLGGLILDRCVNRHGVWFDKGELSEYINKNSDVKQNETITFLGEKFIK